MPVRKPKSQRVFDTSVKLQGVPRVKAQGAQEVTPEGKVEPACFVGHTLVYVYDGYGLNQFRIEDVLPGSLVLSRCEKTGEQAFKPMVNFFEHEDREIWSVTHIDEVGDEESLYTTAEHPFWVEGLGWIPVAQLKPGQLLASSNPFINGLRNIKGSMPETLVKLGRSTTTIVSVKKEEYRLKVYNIEIEGFHTYFVGETGVWVHNACTPQMEGMLESCGFTLNNPAEAVAGLAPDPRTTVSDHTAAGELANKLA